MNGNILKLTNDKKYIKCAEEDLKSGNQVLHLIHSGAGIGKSFLINAVKEAIKDNDESTILACPTRSAATMLDGARNFIMFF